MPIRITSLLFLVCLISACAKPERPYLGVVTRASEAEKVTQEDKMRFRLQEIGSRIQSAGTQTCGRIPKFNNGCIYEFDLANDVNAYTTPGKIHVNSDVMSFAKTDDELAIILGYQYAYNILKNNIKNQPVSKVDYLGLYITALAEFNITSASELMQRLASNPDLSAFIGAPRGNNADRYLAIEKTIVEIKRKQNNGINLVPNLKN